MVVICARITSPQFYAVFRCSAKFSVSVAVGSREGKSVQVAVAPFCLRKQIVFRVLLAHGHFQKFLELRGVGQVITCGASCQGVLPGVAAANIFTEVTIRRIRFIVQVLSHPFLVTDDDRLVGLSVAAVGKFPVGNVWI